MIAERSAPGFNEPDVFRCLNCGSVVVGSPEARAIPSSEAEPNSDADRAAAPPQAMSAMDQFVIRQNIAIYKRQLARETDPARRDVIRRLLEGERAKHASLSAARQIPD